MASIGREMASAAARAGTRHRRNRNMGDLT
jgi:hypothetical protein